VGNPDRWLVLTVFADAPALLALAAEEMIASGGSAVVEEGDSVTTYLAGNGNAERVAAELHARLVTQFPEGAELRVELRWQENEDWALTWKRGLQPRQITDRIVVKPTWTEWEAKGGEVVIDVDPQMAFGTGEHATTRGCLRLLDASLRPGDRVLDVGSGSAILGIAAARLGAGEVVAVEYDPDANLNARENLERNGVAERVRIIEALADPALLSELGRFDLILANILSGVIRPLLPSFRTALAAGGRLIVSGILQTEYEEVVRAALASGLRLEREDREDEWWSALLRPDDGADVDPVRRRPDGE
jgi:ribosomal protein L11 methyltransferase